MDIISAAKQGKKIKRPDFDQALNVTDTEITFENGSLYPESPNILADDWEVVEPKDPQQVSTPTVDPQQPPAAQ